MSKTAKGRLLLVGGLVVTAGSNFVLDLPSGLQISVTFLFGVVPGVIGAAMIWSDFRSAAKNRDPEVSRLAGIKEQIVWRAVAQGGQITAAEAAIHAGLAPMEAEHALMSLVSEGRAAVEPGDAGDIVYRVDSPVGGVATA